MSRLPVVLAALLWACGGSSSPAAAPSHGAPPPTQAAVITPAVVTASPPPDGTHFLRVYVFDSEDCVEGGSRGVTLRGVLALVLEGDAAQLFITVEREEETDGGCAVRGPNSQRRERLVGTSKTQGGIRRLRFGQGWPAELLENTYAHGEPRDVDLTLECDMASVPVYAENAEDIVGVVDDDPPTNREAVRCRPSRAVFDDRSADLWLVDGSLWLGPEPGLEWRTARPWADPTPNGIRAGSTNSYVRRAERQAATW